MQEPAYVSIMKNHLVEEMGTERETGTIHWVAVKEPNLIDYSKETPVFIPIV